MRTETTVASEEVLAVVLPDVAGQLTHSPSAIRQMVAKEGWGGSDTKDFLPPDASSLIINRKDNSRRRKCTAIFLSKLPDELRTNIKQGKINSTTYQNGSINNYIQSPLCSHQAGGNTLSL